MLSSVRKGGGNNGSFVSSMPRTIEVWPDLKLSHFLSNQDWGFGHWLTGVFDACSIT